MQLIGQKSNLGIINKWNNLPPFIIITGDEHTGKTHLTLYLCQKFGLHYKLMKNGINDVRKLIDVMKPGSNTVYHFKNFHTSSIRAKNALLKITEEPVLGNYIVITGSSQLKTLESRGRKIVMEPYSQEEVCEYMSPYYNNTELQNKLYMAGFNTPAKVETYKQYEHIEPLLNYTYDIFGKITYLTVDDIIVMLHSFESKYEGVDACLLFLTMLINIIESNIKTKHFYSYYDILNILIQSRKSLVREPTLNRKFLLYRTFYNIYLLGVVKQ